MDVNFILRWSLLTFFALRQEKYSFLDEEDWFSPKFLLQVTSTLRTRQNWTFVIICSRRPPNRKTGHFRSQKERERLRNVKNENCTCKACKTIVCMHIFDNQICKFVGFMMPSSSWLRKLPNCRAVRRRRKSPPRWITVLVYGTQVQ